MSVHFDSIIHISIWYQYNLLNTRTTKMPHLTLICMHWVLMVWVYPGLQWNSCCYIFSFVDSILWIIVSSFCPCHLLSLYCISSIYFTRTHTKLNAHYVSIRFARTLKAFSHAVEHIASTNWFHTLRVCIVFPPIYWFWLPLWHIHTSLCFKLAIC
jgi:hypothetical protein